MFKSSLFGYSKKQVNTFLDQIELDYRNEEEKLKALIQKNEDACQMLQKENQSDQIRLNEAKLKSRQMMESVYQMLMKKPK